MSLSLSDRLARLEKLSATKSKLRSRLFWMQYATFLIEAELATFSPDRETAEKYFLDEMGCASISEWIDSMIQKICRGVNSGNQS